MNSRIVSSVGEAVKTLETATSYGAEAETAALGAAAKLVRESLGFPAAPASSKIVSSVMDLSNAKFDRVLAEERFYVPLYSAMRPRAFGEVSISRSNFRGLVSSYDELGGSLRDAAVSGSMDKFERVHDIFERSTRPALKAAGFETMSAGLMNRAQLGASFDFPQLNPRIEGSGGVFDLNTRVGMLGFLKNDPDSKLNQELIKEFTRSDAPVLRSAERGVIYNNSEEHPALLRLRDPEYADLDRTGGPRLAVPMRLNLTVPDRTGRALSLWLSKDMPLEATFTRFEEVTHLFQNLNEAPLTRMGAALNEGTAPELAELVKKNRTEFQKDFWVGEGDLVGVWREFGIPFPEHELYAYDRGALKDFMA